MPTTPHLEREDQGEHVARRLVFARPPETAEVAADLFVLPPPLPAPAVGRRERRKVRRHARYDARRKAGLCVACGRLPAAAAHLSRCKACLEIQIRSASRRKRRSNCQSTAHLTSNDLDRKSAAVIVTRQLEKDDARRPVRAPVDK